MCKPADEDDGEARLVVATLLGLGPGLVFVVAVIDRVFVGDETKAGRGGHGENRDSGIEESDEAAERTARDADEIARTKQQAVADDAAHPRGQGPTRCRRKSARDRRRRDDTDNPETELERAAIE
ncbi:hypothetical protein FG93_03739 [Bosea sp. LC85]|nr:hypothetical protein FG93_03739 [Bosea sp. LC85]